MMFRHCIMVALWFAAAASPGLGQSVVGNCAMRGSVVDENGAPVAGLFLTAYSTTIDRGHRRIEGSGAATTDDAGQYCMHSLLQAGPVFLLANEWFDFKQSKPLRRKLPATWYPGVTDFGSAKPVDTGADARANFKLATVNTFTISGKIMGLTSLGGIDSHAETREGIRVQNGVSTVDPQRGTFAIEGVSAGNWTFVFTTPGSGDPVYEARLRYVVVDQDIHSAVLSFEHLPSLDLKVNGKQFRATDKTDSKGVVLSLYKPAEDRGVAFSFPTPGLEPGAYKMNVETPFQCIESFSPGDVHLADGNFTITYRKYDQPISVKVGGHCAYLTIRLATSVSSPLEILLVPESLPFRPLVQRAAAVELPYIYYPWPLSPGTYRVYAFKTLDGLEYSNPAALSQFSGQTVILEADKKTEITLDVVNSLP
jgi:hypothetical protein